MTNSKAANGTVANVFPILFSNSQNISNTPPHPRGAMRPSRAWISRPTEGVGNAGCPMHPQPRVRNETKHTSNSPRVHRDHPAFPHAMVLTAYFVLSPACEF